MTAETQRMSEGAGDGSAAGDARETRGFEEYRAHVGMVETYDVLSAIQFNLLTSLGMRDEHYLLDVGCGSLRAGRLFIPYLRPGHYFGIEHLPWLIQEGIDNEIGDAMIRIKRPTFSHDDNWTLSIFDRKFDFIIAQSIFSHTSQAQMRRCLGEAKKVLKPDGVFAATFFEGLTNHEGDEWIVRAEYTLARMRELIEEQGLACTPIAWAHPDPQQWLLIHHPGARVPLAEATDAQRMIALQERLAITEQQLMSVRSHPYVRAGLKVKSGLVLAAFYRRHYARLLRRALGKTNA